MQLRDLAGTGFGRRRGWHYQRVGDDGAGLRVDGVQQCSVAVDCGRGQWQRKRHRAGGDGGQQRRTEDGHSDDRRQGIHRQPGERLFVHDQSGGAHRAGRWWFRDGLGRRSSVVRVDGRQQRAVADGRVRRKRLGARGSAGQCAGERWRAAQRNGDDRRSDADRYAGVGLRVYRVARDDRGARSGRAGPHRRQRRPVVRVECRVCRRVDHDRVGTGGATATAAST